MDTPHLAGRIPSFPGLYVSDGCVSDGAEHYAFRNQTAKCKKVIASNHE